MSLLSLCWYSERPSWRVSGLDATICRIIKRFHSICVQLYLILWRIEVLAFLIDEKGNSIERLDDIPISLKDDEKRNDYWRFPVSSTKIGCAYDVIEARLSDFVTESGARIRVFAFVDRDQHKAILDYM